MNRRRLIGYLALIVAFVLVGFGVNRGLYSLKSSTPSGKIVAPDSSHPLVNLPGSVLVVQNGAIYRLVGSNFTRITPIDGWEQPHVMANGDIVAVQRLGSYSNLALLSSNGKVINWLTNFGQGVDYVGNSDVATYHWGFEPFPNANGTAIFFAYEQEQPGASYDVTFSIWSLPVTTTVLQDGSQWSTPNDYTGGDVQPIAAPNGGVIYTKFDINRASGATYGQLYYQANATAQGNFITPASSSCEEPSLNPTATEIAFICVNNQAQSSTLEVAPFNASTDEIGKLHTIAVSGLPASPSWSSNGNALLYMSPTQSGGHFQLWVIDNPNAAKPTAQDVTTDLNLDATSVPDWTASS